MDAEGHAGGVLGRRRLAELAAAAKLDAEASRALLAQAGAAPSAAAWQRAIRGFAIVGGALSLGFGVVFLIAANWSALGAEGRLWLVQGLFCLAIGVALYQPPPALIGRAALLLAFIGTGAMFALFGQTYQTGADVYELFAAWTVLGVPLVLAARWSGLTLAWILVANTALALFCGVVPGQHPLWALLGFDERDWAQRLLLAMLPNLVIWALAETGGARWPWLSALLPRWLRRLLLVAGLAYGTLAASYTIVDGEQGSGGWVLLYLLAAAGVGYVCSQVRREPMGLVALAASGIVLGLAVLIQLVDEEALLFLLPAWIVAASTLSAIWLLPLVRRWEGQAHEH